LFVLLQRGRTRDEGGDVGRDGEGVGFSCDDGSPAWGLGAVSGGKDVVVWEG
jgi:hypothetical protein